PWTPPSITGNSTYDLVPAPISGARVHALAIKGDTLYFGGNFHAVGGQPRTGLAAVDLHSGALRPWNPKLIKGTEVQYMTVDIEVRDLVIWRDRLIAAGFFSEEGIPGNPDEEGANRLGHVTAFDLVAGAPMPWESKPEYPVFSLAANTNYVYWTGAGKGPPRNDVSQLDPATGRMLNRRATDGNLQSAFATDDYLIIGGHQDNITPDVYASLGEEESLAVRNRVMMMDPDTLELMPFAPKVDNVGDGVWSVQADGDSLVVAGEFRRIDGVSVHGLQHYDMHDPFVRAVSPTNVPAGVADQKVTIYGANFSGTPTVNMGPGVAVKSVTLVSPKQLDVTISTVGAAEGIRALSVTSAGDTSRCLSCFALGTAEVGNGGPIVPVENPVNNPPVVQDEPGGYWL
ncbi:MAG: hypothetical protein ACRDKW_18370, partial [Actinomycetota bacterium]